MEGILLAVGWDDDSVEWWFQLALEEDPHSARDNLGDFVAHSFH